MVRMNAPPSHWSGVGTAGCGGGGFRARDRRSRGWVERSALPLSVISSLVIENLNVGQAGRVVDADVHELPALVTAPAVMPAGALASQDAVSGPGDPSELVDIDVDQLARTSSLITLRRLQTEATELSKLIADQIAAAPADAARVLDDEISGHGELGHLDSEPPAGPARPANGRSGPNHRPAGGRGRSGLPRRPWARDQGRLDALVVDYLLQAAKLDCPPVLCPNGHL